MHKFQFLFLLCFSFVLHSGFAQAKLEKLITEREALHAEWKASENQKSGIFGNRTKKDMIETNDWLQRIIHKDDQIIAELKLLGSIETAVIGQEKEDYKSIAFNCEAQVQTLKRVLSEKEEEITEKISTRRTFEWASFVFFCTTLGLAVWNYKMQKRR